VGSFAVGDVVVVRFPFSDLSSTKLRPALVIADGDFIEGNLRSESYIRPKKLFTAAESIVKHSVGRLTTEKLSEVREALVRTFGNASAQ
jgi:mRNA interferase MazF